MQFPADNYPVVFWNSSNMRTHIMHIPLENAVGKKRTGNGGLCFNILSCGKFLKGRACQSVIPPPHFCTLGPLLIWRSLKWEAMCGWCGVFIPFSPFFMFGLMLLLRGSLPSPPLPPHQMSYPVTVSPDCSFPAVITTAVTCLFGWLCTECLSFPSDHMDGGSGRTMCLLPYPQRLSWCLAHSGS